MRNTIRGVGNSVQAVDSRRSLPFSRASTLPARQVRPRLQHGSLRHLDENPFRRVQRPAVDVFDRCRTASYAQCAGS